MIEILDENLKCESSNVFIGVILKNIGHEDHVKWDVLFLLLAVLDFVDDFLGNARLFIRDIASFDVLEEIMFASFEILIQTSGLWIKLIIFEKLLELFFNEDGFVRWIYGNGFKIGLLEFSEKLQKLMDLQVQSKATRRFKDSQDFTLYCFYCIINWPITSSRKMDLLCNPH